MLLWNSAATGVPGATKRGAMTCAEHQKMASKSVVSGGSLLEGMHRDMCGVLCKWRQQVAKHGASPDVLRADLLHFLGQ